MTPPAHPVYPVEIVSCYDADTCTVNIDTELGIIFEGQKVRLEGLDAPEIRGPERPEGLRSRQCLLKMLKPPILAKFSGKGKYGRWIVRLWDRKGLDINQALIDQGCAEKVKY